MGDKVVRVVLRKSHNFCFSIVPLLRTQCLGCANRLAIQIRHVWENSRVGVYIHRTKTYVAPSWNVAILSKRYWFFAHEENRTKSGPNNGGRCNCIVMRPLAPSRAPHPPLSLRFPLPFLPIRFFCMPSSSPGNHSNLTMKTSKDHLKSLKIWDFFEKHAISHKSYSPGVPGTFRIHFRSGDAANHVNRGPAEKIANLHAPRPVFWFHL